MKVPVSVKMGGLKVKIDYVDDLPDDDGSQLSGDANSLSRRIRINKSQHDAGEKLLATLLHELMHVALGLCGHSELLGDKKEEAIVGGLETMLAPLLVLNSSTAIKYKEIDFPWED